MSTVSLLVAMSADRRLAAAAEWLRQIDGGALVVAPTRGAADDLVRRGLEPGQGVFGVHRITPTQLVAELATPRLAATGRAPVTRVGVDALIARAIGDCREAGRLGYFDPVAAYPGFPRALASTLLELRMHAIDDDQVAGSGPAGADLAQLERSYGAALQQFDLVDEPVLWQLAADVVGESPHAYLGLPLLLLDLSPESVREARLWQLLAQRSRRVLATVIGGDRRAAELMEAALGCAPTSPDRRDPGEVASRLQRLHEWVFLDLPDEPSAAVSGDDQSVSFLAAPGEGRESVEIARRIQSLARDGVPYDRMAVLVRDPNSYMSLLEEALESACIPAFFSRGTVRPDPSGRAFLALLACKAEGLTASRFAEYLSLGEIPVLDSGGAPAAREVPWVKPEGAQLVFKSSLAAEPIEEMISADADLETAPVIAGSLRIPRRWERLLVDAAVVGGRDRWARRLRGLQAELQLRHRALEDGDATLREQLERQIDGLRNLDRFAMPVIDALDALPESVVWGVWLERLRRLATLTLQHPDRVLGVLAELAPMSEVGPVSLGEVQRALEERLAVLRTEPRGRRYGKVFVASIEEAAARSFDTVFLPGLAEGIFPRRASEDPLLLDTVRRGLSADLPDQDRRIEQERRLLRLAAGAAERQIIVSYPTIDTIQGRARVPSFYALDVLRASEGRLPDLEVLRQHAAESSSALLGWPAPSDPTLAIDEAEFDVAFLQPLITSPSEDPTGRARFLLETNVHLERSLRTRWHRWSSKLTAADGIVDPDEASLAALQSQRLTSRTYSPTALQNYAACPYRFLLYAIHRLRPREESVALEQIDPLTRGSLFHEVQYSLFVELRERSLLPVTMTNRDQVADIAGEILAAKAETYRERLAPAIERVWRDEIESIGTDLRGWVYSVAESGESWVPTYFEFSFGLGREAGRDPLSHRDEAVVLDGYRLRGSIDLVEYDPARERWRVTDHKTGRAPRERLLVTKHGEILQPLLYALAAEYHLGGGIESGRLYYCTRRGEYETRTVALNAENRDKARQLLGIIDQAIAEGFLPAAPRDRACEWCDYKPVCGPYEQTRLRGKNRSRLAPLELIRGAS